MAKRSFRPYSTSGRKKNSPFKYLIILIVLGAGVYFAVDFLRHRGDESTDQPDLVVDNGTDEDIVTPEPAVEPDTPEVRDVDTDPEQVIRDAQEFIAQTQQKEPQTTEPISPAEEAKPDAKAAVEDPGQEILPGKGGLTVDDAQLLQARRLIDEANKDILNGDYIAARAKLNDVLHQNIPDTYRQAVKAKMAELSNKWLFSSKVLSGDKLCETYEIKRGDYLVNIGKANNVPAEILQDINGITDPTKVPAGKKIKIVKGPFHAKVNRKTCVLDLYLQSVYVRSYKVAVGSADTPTPTGLWKVTPGGKSVKPDWTDPDTGKHYTKSSPDYPLGSRWIALTGLEGDAESKTGFAIHGTNEPESIGSAVSRGCIRMDNDDVIKIYNMMMPGKSQVRVEE